MKKHFEDVLEKEALIKEKFSSFHESLKAKEYFDQSRIAFDESVIAELESEVESEEAAVLQLKWRVFELERDVKDKKSALEEKDAAIDKLEKMKDDAATHMFESIGHMDQVRGKDATPLQKAEDITRLWPKIVEHTFAAATLLLGHSSEPDREPLHENVPSLT